MKKARIKIFLYSSAALLVLGVMLMREFVWRYQSPFSLHLTGTLTNGLDTSRVNVDEYTETRVDTVQSEFENTRSGVTTVTITKREGPDTLRFIAHGHYYSSVAPITFSSDRAKEMFLIPNTEQGLALGLGELIYLDTAGMLSAIHVQSSNVADTDGDSVFELRDMRTREFLHLDRAQKKWVVTSKTNGETRPK